MNNVYRAYLAMEAFIATREAQDGRPKEGTGFKLEKELVEEQRWPTIGVGEVQTSWSTHI